MQSIYDFWNFETLSKRKNVIAELKTLEGIQNDFDGDVSIADLIVLGGCAAVEKAAHDAIKDYFKGQSLKQSLIETHKDDPLQTIHLRLPQTQRR